jgi:hypothetical protein
MKKSVLIMVSFLLMLSMMASSAFASSNKIITDEQQLNTLLTKVGTPAEVINGLQYYAKYNLINKTGADLKFDRYSKESYTRNSVTGKLNPITNVSLHSNGLMSPMGFISPTDLSIVLAHFTYTSGGITYHDVYSSFEWFNSPASGPPGIDKDQIGIAVPTDWEIQSTGYACAVQTATYIGPGWTTWTSPDSSKCGVSGQPQSHEIYGASWELHGGTTIQKFKGTAHLVMRNKGSLTNRVTSKYMEAHSNPLGNFSVSIGYGPGSVTYTPSSGSTDELSNELVWP